MKVMVVDDSMAMRLIIIKTLREAGFSGHEIIQAEDGEIALGLIEEDRPDLVLCDWNMPNMSGLELLEALNDAEIVLPFGFITTETTASMRQKAIDMGARFLIAKPFTPKSFQLTLESYFQ